MYEKLITPLINIFISLLPIACLTDENIYKVPHGSVIPRNE